MPSKPKYELPELQLDGKSIGERIAQIRKSRSLTQKELGNKIGIPLNIVSDYERSRLRLYDEMVTRFAIALEVSADEILGLKKIPIDSIQQPSLKDMKRLKAIHSLPKEEQRKVDEYIKDLAEKFNK